MRNMLETPSTILEERLEVLHDLATIKHGEQRRAANANLEDLAGMDSFPEEWE